MISFLMHSKIFYEICHTHQKNKNSNYSYDAGFRVENPGNKYGKDDS